MSLRQQSGREDRNSAEDEFSRLIQNAGSGSRTRSIPQKLQRGRTAGEDEEGDEGGIRGVTIQELQFQTIEVHADRRDSPNVVRIDGSINYSVINDSSLPFIRLKEQINELIPFIDRNDPLQNSIGALSGVKKVEREFSVSSGDVIKGTTTDGKTVEKEATPKYILDLLESLFDPVTMSFQFVIFDAKYSSPVYGQRIRRKIGSIPVKEYSFTLDLDQ